MAERNILYKVSTKRDKKMVKDFILFTYRVSHPKVTRNFIIVGLVSLALTYGLRVSAIKYFLWIQAAFCILMGLFRHWIPISRMMKSDPDIVAGNVLSYEFDSKEIRAYRNDELYLKIDNYKKVHNLYHDEEYYFLGANEEDLLILPKSCFERGDFEEFKSFIEKKAGIEAKWSPMNRRFW